MDIIGGLHGAESIVDRPDIRLHNWRILLVSGKYDDSTSHFAGTDIELNEGRVSSTIEEFDKTTMKGRTLSGRIYELIGEPGWSANADYVWKNWKAINQVTEEINVSDRYYTIKEL